ncbi:MAG: hypothetical protein HY688_04760 [Chloroflexi bacterium]|nr:hypothetical protein [Chloroflexota bacterium]
MSIPSPWMAYGAGVAAFVAPCTLVLVPFFLLYLAGAAVLKGGPGGAPRLGTMGLWFALGFVPAFVAVWSFPNAIEVIVRWSRLLERAGGVVLIVYGVAVAGLLLLAGARFGGLLGGRWWGLRLALALLIGATFAVGWTPCVGKTLSRILGLTGGPQGVAASLLLLYGLGLMTPFVALGWTASWSRLESVLARSGVRRWAAPVAGAGLIAVGLVVLTGNLRELTAYLYALAPGLAL